MPNNATTFRVGDYVTPNPEFSSGSIIGRRFRVEKVNPKNLICKPVDADGNLTAGKGLNYPPYALLPAPAGLVTGSLAPAAPAKAEIDDLPIILLNGTIVTTSHPYTPMGVTTDTPLIVLADKGARVNVAILGGTDGRYLRVNRSSLTVRDTRWLAAHLAGN